MLQEKTHCPTIYVVSTTNIVQQVDILMDAAASEPCFDDCCTFLFSKKISIRNIIILSKVFNLYMYARKAKVCVVHAELTCE